jgi:peptide chain release factor 2
MINNLKLKVKKLELDQVFSEREDSLGAILEINAGAGGKEAMDWCQMLMRMYSRWAANHGFTVELLDRVEGEGGLKSVSILINGYNVFGMLKDENGVHRLVRNSPFSSSDSRHTSFAAVAVTPDFPEENDTIVVKHEDYKREAFCSGGSGGQNVNKVASAVRLTHFKTGIIVKVQTERSQHENFRIAMQTLKGKLFAYEKAKKDSDFKEKYEEGKSSIAFGHAIRSYVLFPQQMVRDERTECFLHNAESVLDGNIDQLLESEWMFRLKNKEAK